jgi:anaerobic C4-dicarboxylate transporter
MGTKKEALEFKDDFVASILQNKNQKTLDESFEKQLMNAIIEKQAYKKEVTSKLKKSMGYFFAGILLIGLYSLFIIIDKSFFKSSMNILSVFILFFTIILSIVVIDNYKRFFKSFSF